MPKFCPDCGLQLVPGNVKFCPECGVSLSRNQEQFKIQDQIKKQSIKFALKIVGILSIFLGFSIIFYTYGYPVTEILGQGITLAQMHS